MAAEEKQKLTDEEWRKRQSEYNRFMASTKWRLIRQQKIAMAEGCCERCGEHRLQLHVHHKTYVRFGGMELPKDLEVLCKPCHVFEHKLLKNPRLQRKVANKKRAEAKIEARKKIREKQRQKKMRKVPKGWLPPGGLTWSYREQDNASPARVVWSRSDGTEPPPPVRRRVNGETQNAQEVVFAGRRGGRVTFRLLGSASGPEPKPQG